MTPVQMESGGSTYHKLRAELQRRSEKITRQVCDIRLGDAPTRSEVERLDQLRAMLLCDWDAINPRWVVYTPDE